MDPIMLTQLTTDLCRILKHNLARFDNDASACYDRIIVNLGMLAARRCGMPLNAIQTHAEALQFMQYTVKTVHGISADNYSGTPFAPLFGTGQGSGASPAVWLSLVVILMNTLDHLIPERMEFQSPDASIKHSRLIDAFVDDTSLGFTDPGLLSHTEMITRINHIAQTWERLLHFSGGSLNLSKCSWYIMYWDWTSGRPALRPISPTDPKVLLTRGSDRETTTQVKCTSVDQASRLLGVYLSPSGDFSEQLKVMKTKADNYATRLRSPRLTAQDIRVFHKTTYTPAMRYSLAALAVDEEELGSVQSKVLAAMLQGMGVSSKLPTAIRHAPLDMGGIELLDLRTEMGIASLRLIRNSVFANSEVGKMIVMNVQYSQLEAGTGYNILEKPSQHVSYLTPTWITSVRQFISNHAITITFTEQLLPALRTTRDKYIMDPNHLHRYSLAQQHDINLVRIYLQATTLSDMSAGTDGRTICTSYAKGIRPSDFKHSSTWPRQATPSLKQQRLWTSYITTSYIRYHPYWEEPMGAFLPKTGTTHKTSIDPLHTPNEATSYSSLRKFLKAIPRFYSRLLSHYEQKATDLQVWQAFRSKKRLEIVTDGSLESHTTGTFGWKLMTPKDVTLYQGTGPVDGPPEISSSTRSELGGFAAPLLLIAAVARFWGLRHRCRYRWIVDSQCAITKVKLVTFRGSKPRRQLNNVDYLSLIASLHNELRAPRPSPGSKSPGPDNKLLQPSRDARNNVDVDALAATHSNMKRTKPIQHIPHLPILRVTMTAGAYDS
ncbi:hypothetical protein MHU86_12617 [Fragilaria crotonensis]|nr:hypothetical protein MHU86_12617 [Fragilaria crotonensis]